MQAAHLDLTASYQPSRVLAQWLADDPGRAARAGVVVRNAGSGTVTSSDRDGMLALFQPILSSAGVPVTDQTAMQVSTVYACLSKLAGSITQLPIHEYGVGLDGQRERLSPTVIWWLLNESPDDAWTAASWKEWIVRCVFLRGDQHTEILRKGAAVAGLRVHHPDNVRPYRVGSRIMYDCVDPYTGKAYGVEQDDMLHFTGLGYDGLRSLSAIGYAARQAVGNSLAAANFAGRTLGEGAMPQIALQYPNKMAPDQADLLRKSFVATYGGSGGRKLPLVLTEGATAKELSISPADLELMSLRNFEKADICEALGVPPILIGNSEKASSWGTGIEQIVLGFVIFTIKPHLTRWGEELNRKLYKRAGRFVEFELDALLGGDSKAQAEFFRAALGGPGTGNGWMRINEVRKLKNLPPVPGGDELFRAQSQPAADPATAKDPAS